MEKITVFWFRRDLRLDDNHALHEAIKSGNKIIFIFIFDFKLLEKFEEEDKRIRFIYKSLDRINNELLNIESGIDILYGKPLDVFKNLTYHYNIERVFANHEYEPYSIQRDELIKEYLSNKNITFHTYKDHVIFEKDEIVKNDKNPYTVFTSYKNKWLSSFDINLTNEYKVNLLKENVVPKHEKKDADLDNIKDIFKIYPIQYKYISDYDKTRDYPGLNATTKVGVHLRFGTISTRKLVKKAYTENMTFLNELIWREFFIQLLHHYPHVVDNSFSLKYKNFEWVNNEEAFELWCEGKTGYPIVDAGMRQLNETGFMHNRARMITASFLCKHLLIDWKLGEQYFSLKLMDYELASNNGNWQWAAGTGCDAAPYFRVFNPKIQQQKFDPNNEYIKKWIPNFDEKKYIKPIVEHSFARNRAIEHYKRQLS